MTPEDLQAIGQLLDARLDAKLEPITNELQKVNQRLDKLDRRMTNMETMMVEMKDDINTIDDVIGTFGEWAEEVAKETRVPFLGKA